LDDDGEDDGVDEFFLPISLPLPDFLVAVFFVFLGAMLMLIAC
jgi:hypothetical protein